MGPFIPNSPTQQQVLNVGMLLMFGHPRDGAESLAIQLGESAHYKPGWNHKPGIPGKRRENWVFIGPDHGRLYWTKPQDLNGPVNETSFIAPPLTTTAAWSFLHRQAAQAGPHSKEFELARHIESMDTTVSYPIDTDAETTALRKALAEMQVAANNAHSAEMMVKPIADLVLKVLRFESLGQLGARALSSVLMNVGEFLAPHQDDLSEFLDVQFSIRDYLGDLVWRLFDARRGTRIGTCETMTYLAALYAQTSLYHSDLLRVSKMMDVQRTNMLAKLDQNIDELLCHEGLPVFAFYSLSTFDRFMRAGRDPYWEPFVELHAKRTEEVDTLTFEDLIQKYFPVSSEIRAGMWATLQTCRED